MGEKRTVEYVDVKRDQRILKQLPDATRAAIGEELTRLQRGDDTSQLLQYRPLTGFGPGVGELKRGPWRVVLSTSADPTTVWIVCVFKKDSPSGSTMPKKHRKLIESSLDRLSAHITKPNTSAH